MRIKKDKIILVLFSSLLMGASCSNSQKQSSPINSNITDTHGQETLVAHTFVWDDGKFETENWETPNYENQDSRIGWKPNSFTVPKGLEVNVNFWKNIYQKYSSHEGVLHDSYHIDLVYEVVDFRPIMRDSSLTQSQKLRARRKLVDGLKRKVKTAIVAIRKNHKLDSYAQNLKQKISSYKEKNILRELPKKGRLRFQLGQKDYIQKGMFHSGAYMAEIERIFAEYKLPKQLARLPYVESSFNLKARSKVGASGIWQIMPSTARGKLARSYYYDYRNHPLEAAHVAAKLLRYNYKVLGDWPRAITAYNFGAAGMRRLSKKLRTSDISEMAKKRHRRWGFAASNFYASYLAVLDTENKASELFGSKFQKRKSLEQVRVKLKKGLSWKWFQAQWPGKMDEVKRLNPQFAFHRMDDFSLLRRGLVFYLPKSGEVEFQAAVNATKAYQPKNSFRIHRVSRGETLSNIARRYRVSVSSIMKMNQIASARYIQIGQKLRVPMRMNR